MGLSLVEMRNSLPHGDIPKSFEVMMTSNSSTYKIHVFFEDSSIEAQFFKNSLFGIGRPSAVCHAPEVSTAFANARCLTAVKKDSVTADRGVIVCSAPFSHVLYYHNTVIFIRQY